MWMKLCFFLPWNEFKKRKETVNDLFISVYNDWIGWIAVIPCCIRQTS